MRPKHLRVAALAAALGALALPATALGVAQITDRTQGLADYDARAGAVAPSKAQRAAVRKLRARVSWNRFGTPATLSKRGKFLAKGVKGKNATEAARRWLYRNRVLFGLPGVDKLLLVGDTRMPSSRGHAVNFRQVIGGVQTAEGGLVTVGITGSAKSGWKVAYVSSSLTRDTSLVGRAKLSAPQGWASAADSVGERYSLAQIRGAKAMGGWTTLVVAGLADLQRVKLVAFPTVRAGIVPAFESIVLKGMESVAYRVIVDARNGAVLSRTNLVHNLAASNGSLQATTFTFGGSVPATEGACDAKQGPFTVPGGVRALDGFVAATLQTNDVVVNLYFGTTKVLADVDTFLSPEIFRYEPSGGVPPGDYFVEVCDFPGQGVWAEPRTYTGTLTLDDSPAPIPSWAQWKVFPANPSLNPIHGYPWGNLSADTREVWCWRPADGCDKVVGNLASRGPWDHDHKLNTPTHTTKGNNARAATSWTHPFLPFPPQWMPPASDRNYTFPWTNNWFNTGCAPTPGAPGSTWDDSAATVNLFVAHNRMHDWAYFLGFIEQNWNAQDYNFGLTEPRQENDPIQGDVQSGVLVGQRDNANMITLADGVASITNMYMWQALPGAFYAPCVDGDYDMGVIGHEYTHMIENRMIGKGIGRSGHHAGAMGESWGDMFAMEYLNENGFVPTGGENRYAVGTYATGNSVRAIRNYGMNFPMSGDLPRPSKQLGVNALNFSDMGYDLTGPQVHADGEIWSATNFRIRTLFNNKYDDDFDSGDADLQESCAAGELPPQNCPGNRRWAQLLFDAFLLMPTDPSMLQARDAILTADLMRFGGANQRELWLGFARSGFGEGATSSNTAANTDTDPTPSFKSPLHNNAEIRFRARATGGGTIETARIFIGHYEGRVSPIADTNPATTGSPNLDDVAEIAPGTYELVANAPGYGHLRTRKTFRAGEQSVIEFRFPTNHASAARGATATGDGTGQARLIDDTEGTFWESVGNIDAAGNLSVDGKKVTIDLAGADPVRIRELQVSAELSNNVNRFTALRQFEVWACNAGEGDCSTDAGFDKVYTSAADAFPGDPPRPVQPHLILRTFDIPNVRATHLRLVVKTSQCTGGPLFQGDQDADPTVNADCDSNVAANATRRFVRAAEFQAFSQEGSVLRFD
jgi:extracellular elastinolytic metalloproteinase